MEQTPSINITLAHHIYKRYLNQPKFMYMVPN